MDTDMTTKITEKDFYSQHGIWGAYASLVLGRAGRGSGLVVGDVQPPDSSLFVGYKAGHDEAKLLPFIRENVKIGLDGSAYVSENKVFNVATKKTFSTFAYDEIDRRISMSGEEWRAGRMSFRVTSFLGSVPDPQKVSPQIMRNAICPALLVTLSFDNSGNESPLIGYFGMNDINRSLSDSTNGRLLGMAKGCGAGFAVLQNDAIDEVMDWDAVEAAFNGTMTLRKLSSAGGLRFTVEPGAVGEFVVALGVYDDGVVTSGYSARRYYTCLYKDLEDALETALENSRNYFDRAEQADALLHETPIDDERKFIVAHATHSYCASTELLLDNLGNPLFVVNEGEYRMMNTLDLTVDHAYYELCFSPWTLRNELDFFVKQSMYTDSFGVAFSHDQGVADSFSPRGHSAYELPGLVDCFSYMSYEETLNWTLSACLYIHNSGDAKWAEEKSDILERSLASLRARDKNGDGIMDADSDRCEGGAEITTYDSLDISLGQARNNLYLAVKAWGTFACLDAFFAKRGNDAAAKDARDAATAIAKTVSSHFDAQKKFIPAVFEGGNQSRIIPAVEGLAYPFLAGAPDIFSGSGPYASFISLLRQHLDTVLVPGTCIDPVSGGWKLSSTSKNTWMSKIFLNQFIAEYVLDFPQEKIRHDGAHARWLRNGSADFAATDQVESDTGKDLGSRLYPRLVTSILWILPHHRFECLKMPQCK